MATAGTMFKKVYTQCMKIANNIISSNLHRVYLDNLIKSVEEKSSPDYDKSQLFKINILHNLKLTCMLHYRQIVLHDTAEIENSSASSNTTCLLPVPSTLKTMIQISNKRKPMTEVKQISYLDFELLIKNSSIDEL
jgi:hypothetical protein